MSKIVLVFLMTIGIAQYALAQIGELGKVKPEELTMTVCAADSSAEAVVLEDRGTAFLSKSDTRGYFVEYRRYTRIKILKRQGIDYANVIVPFYNLSEGRYENFGKIAGRTYNGSEFQDMAQDAIFEEKKTDQYIQKKFTLPNVREGSVIEYAYTFESDLVFNLRDWNFQRAIPTLRSDYTLYLLPGFEYRILFQGINKFVVDESLPVLGGIKYHWAVANIAALKKEPYITTIEDYRSKVYFELIATYLNSDGRRPYSKSWDDLDRTLITSSDFGGALRVGFLKDSLENIKNNYADTVSRVAAVYDFVRKNMNYNGKETYFVDKSLKDAYQSRSGSVAEINLMLVAMLRALDLPANPVILSTRSNGRFSKDYPLLSKFDYVVAHIELNGKNVLIDATDKFRKIGTIPFACLNGEGRLIAKKSKWIDLKPAEKQSEIHIVSLQILQNMQLKGNMSQSYAGYAATELRKKIFEINKDRYKEEIVSANRDWQINKIIISAIDNTNESVKVSFDVLMGEEQETAKIYLNPIVSGRLVNNPFKNTNRAFPLNFGTVQEYVYVGSFVLPEGYEVEELPKNTAFALPDGAGRFVYASQIDNNTIKISTRFTINRTVFEAQEYDLLREFYDKVVAKQAELMVLKKK